MIRTLRILFLERALREKLLVLAFLAIGVAWWASAYGTRASGFWRDQRVTTLRLREQEQWIKNQNNIEEAAQKMTGRFDPARTLNGNQLVATVSQLAGDAGLQYRAGQLVNRPTGQFTLHEVEFTMNNFDWDALRKFYQAVQQRSPYIAMERFILSAPNRANPAQLTLAMKFVSVEITRR